MSEWNPNMDEAPRDGTEVELTWMEDGEPQEIWPMRWNPFASNLIAQPHRGLWAMHDRYSGALLCTWTESRPDGAPTHWRLPSPPAQEEK